MILKSILFRLIIFAKERCGCEYAQDKQKNSNASETEFMTKNNKSRIIVEFAYRFGLF